MTETNGVALACDRNDDPLIGAIARCVLCGGAYRLQVAVLQVLAGGERIGFIGPCCVAQDAREKLATKCREYARTWCPDKLSGTLSGQSEADRTDNPPL